MGKERLDVVMLQRGLAISRERAKACIMAGKVFVGGKKVDKAGTLVAPDADITVSGDGIGYVSRGGLKLAKALTAFSIDLQGKVMADIGASTGGFTDCALKNGAAKVFAIDVGYGQLAWSLRTDPRVVNMERTNIRDVTSEMLGTALDFVVIDVAFISLDKVLPVARKLLAPAGRLVALIKPQFEAGREKVGKKGVVRDPEVHYEVICRILTISRQLGLYPVGLSFSPVKGPEGNIEYLLYMTAADDGSLVDDIAAAKQVVQEAHLCLNG
jgi:23S rRNA (cytidine1920-2'-O)/16S rRNA (cytidine1409-2'-O)-methyltransferase